MIMTENPRASLRPIDDAFRCMSAPPPKLSVEAGGSAEFSSPHRRGIDELFRESVSSERRAFRANDGQPTLSLSWNDAKDVGHAISRPRSALGAPGRLRGPTLTSFEPEHNDVDKGVTGTLQSLSASIHSLALNSKPTTAAAAETPSTTTTNTNNTPAPPDRSKESRQDTQFVIRDVNAAPPPVDDAVAAVAKTVSEVAAKQQRGSQQYWRSRQPGESQYRGAQEEYYQYRNTYTAGSYARAVPGQMVDMMPPTLTPLGMQPAMYTPYQQQPQMMMQQQIYSLHQNIHKLSVEQQHYGRLRDETRRVAPTAYNVAAPPFTYPPPLPAQTQMDMTAGTGKKSRSRRGGARQRARENARAAQQQHDAALMAAAAAHRGTGLPVVAPVSAAPSMPPSGGAVPIFSAAELRGRVAQLCRDQHGSRFLQAQLEEEETTPEKRVILDEVVPKTRELAADVFGNYVVQKVLTHGDQAAVEGVAEQLSGHAVALSLHVYGCRVVQKALDVLPALRSVELVKEFKSNIVCCVHDQNGNHVVQKCVETTSKARKKARALLEPSPEDADKSGHPERTSPPLKEDATELSELGDQIEFILGSFKGRARDLAMHAYGCRVLQRIFEHCSHRESASILDELRDGELRQLIEDQYANYVVQHAIQYGRPQDRSILVAAVRANLVDFSRHKFASNVVEKCLDYGNPEQRTQLIDEIAAPGAADNERSTLRILIVDNFANYVVQKVVDLADQRQLDNIIDCLKPIVHHVKHTPGKHILGKIEKRCPHVKFN